MAELPQSAWIRVIDAQFPSSISREKHSKIPTLRRTLVGRNQTLSSVYACTTPWSGLLFKAMGAGTVMHAFMGRCYSAAGSFRATGPDGHKEQMMMKAGKITSGVLNIMDHSGHKQLHWNLEELEEVAVARKTFDKLVSRGYSAFGSRENEPKHLIRDFDPTMKEVVMVPVTVGG
jgi:hypothetical protein